MWQPVFLWESSVRSVKKSERMKYKSAVGQMRVIGQNVLMKTAFKP